MGAEQGRRGWAFLAAQPVVLFVLFAGCSGDDGGTRATGTRTSNTATTAAIDGNELETPEYALLTAEGFERGEAIRPLSVPDAMARAEPSFDWWAEHERRSPRDGGVIEGEDVLLTGHDVELDDEVAELKGFRMAEGVVDGRRASLGVSIEGQPAVVSIAVSGDYTIRLLSYALSVEELAAVAERLEVVSEEEWIAAGGRILPCLPLEPGCRPPLNTMTD